MDPATYTENKRIDQCMSWREEMIADGFMDIFNGEGVSGFIVSMHKAVLRGCFVMMRRWDMVVGCHDVI